MSICHFLHPAVALLTALAQEPDLTLDGTRGTQIQNLKLSVEDLSGQILVMSADIRRTIRKEGNTDLLILTQPEVLEEIHYNHAIADADIIKMNMFSSTTIA